MQSDGLAREMDPDAPNRDDTRGLAADDAVRIVLTSESLATDALSYRTTRSR